LFSKKQEDTNENVERERNPELLCGSIGA
jgi:hypothetical protein